MILRDPVHGLVAFEGISERVIGGLLRAREVQRMRRISQLGMTSLVFPGAEHSRFAHALGAAHVMVRLLARIQQIQFDLPDTLRLDEQSRADALGAAFLHDLGHGPFSHLFEEVLPDARRHEDWTLQIINEPSTDVHKVLNNIAAGSTDRVTKLLSRQYPVAYLSRAIDGSLDVDRCDYLLRDSHMTGVSYGVYDLDWLLQALAFGLVSLDEGKQEWVLAIEGRKGLPPVESFFLARQFMYQQVYHHKATRAAEALIRGIFIRVAELVRDGALPQPIPHAIRAAALGEPAPVFDYLELDDVRLMNCFLSWETCKDKVLSDLSRSLINRHLPKTIPLPSGPHAEAKRREALCRAHEVALKHGLRPDIHIRLDTPVEEPYTEVADRSAEGLWVLLSHQTPRRLGEVSFLLGELRNKRIERPRLIFPESIRDEVILAIGGLLE
jgi:HD superfamily phosphohydrolase